LGCDLKVSGRHQQQQQGVPLRDEHEQKQQQQQILAEAQKKQETGPKQSTPSQGAPAGTGATTSCLRQLDDVAFLCHAI